MYVKGLILWESNAVRQWRANIAGNFERAVSNHLSVPVEKVFLVFWSFSSSILDFYFLGDCCFSRREKYPTGIY